MISFNINYRNYLFTHKILLKALKFFFINESYFIFLLQNIAYFVSKASSTNNKFSQCYLMLQTWRHHTPASHIVPRLFDALVGMKQICFAEKIKAEMTSKGLVFINKVFKIEQHKIKFKTWLYIVIFLNCIYTQNTNTGYSFCYFRH